MKFKLKVKWTTTQTLFIEANDWKGAFTELQKTRSPKSQDLQVETAEVLPLNESLVSSLEASKLTGEKAIAWLNEIDMISYMAILGFKPTEQTSGATVYESPFPGGINRSLIVDHATNSFWDLPTNLAGKVADFACKLFKCTPEELCASLALYHLDWFVG